MGLCASSRLPQPTGRLFVDFDNHNVVDGESVFGRNRIAGDEIGCVDGFVDANGRGLLAEVQQDDVLAVVAFPTEGDDRILIVGLS